MTTVMNLLLGVLVALAVTWFLYGLVLLVLQQLGLARGLVCRAGWHSPSRQWEHVRHDGCSEHARCPWCQYEGMVDSQGNLF